MHTYNPADELLESAVVICWNCGCPKKPGEYEWILNPGEDGLGGYMVAYCCDNDNCVRASENASEYASRQVIVQREAEALLEMLDRGAVALYGRADAFREQARKLREATDAVEHFNPA